MLDIKLLSLSTKRIPIKSRIIIFLFLSNTLQIQCFHKNIIINSDNYIKYNGTSFIKSELNDNPLAELKNLNNVRANNFIKEEINKHSNELEKNMQIHFKTKKLSDIYSLLLEHDKNLNYEIKHFKNKNFHIVKVNLKNYTEKIPVKFEFDESQMIIQIGINIFSKKHNELKSNIRKFLERSLLEHCLMDQKVALSNLKTENISISFNGNLFGAFLFQQITDVLPVLLTYNVFSFSEFKAIYQAKWSDTNGNIIQMQFPKRQGLIIGLDKKQLDQELFLRLNNNKSTNSNFFIKNYFPEELKLNPYQDSIYVKNDYKPYNGFSSNTFYVLSEDKFKLLFNQNYPLKSISNLFLKSHFFEDSIFFKINTMSLNREEILISLDHLNSFFQTNHKIYIGFEKKEFDQLHTIVLLKHKEFNHLHLLVFTITPNQIFSNRKYLIKGDFYTNIRQDNLKDISISENFKNNSRQLLDDKIKININRN
jgi:hypothetical protein